MRPILVVDDEPHFRAVVSHWAESFGYPTRQAPDAQSALEMMDGDAVSVAVCDVRMPGHDGLWLTGEIRGRHPDTAIILATGADDGRVQQRARELGAMDYLVKPFGGDQFAGALRRAIDWHRDAVATRAWVDHLRAEQTERRGKLERVLFGADAPPCDDDPRLQELGITAKAVWGEGPVGRIVEWRRATDRKGYEAAQRVMRFAAATAARLGMSARDIETLKAAALLHDLGLLTLPPALMQKPADFTAEERALLRQHPLVAFNLLHPCRELAEVAAVVLSAYEAYSGGGYPQGLTGEQIPLASRVLAVAIAYQGMMTTRPHRPALPSAEAVLELCRCREAQFDSGVVEAFVRVLTAH
jgi:response regulator RpfG family c-di-GMP phosphodiesterase